MGEQARILRYLIPGALVQLPLGAWLVIDRLRREGELPAIDTAVVIGLAAVALAVGFLASNLYSALVWWRRDPVPPRYSWWRVWQLFSWPDDQRLMNALPAWRRIPFGDVVREAAWVDASWHRTMSQRNDALTLSRGRALLDVMNGLASSVMALLLGIVPLVVIPPLLEQRNLSWWLDCGNFILGCGVGFVTLCAAWVLRRSQFRVAETATHYIEASLR